ncbi:PLP-dependent aminotransferase family protein [Pseudonocardia acaciae]|uniref:MocR-like pyridoxine biosynthesis transcription factor PdxR n=1 Tax=Pseudonocardia acaciae TaxID=551276 RepID=UPI000564F211|nr:PLP-dependent aminotransferase family protein [Pseudonocardia acaciae]
MLADDLPIVLDRCRPEPLAVQVADALRAAASGGLLRVGDRLASTRALASRLGVSRTVTAAAYDQLLAEGWLVGRRGSGTFVTAAPPSARHRPATAAAHAPTSGRPVAAAGAIDLTSGRPCLDALDRAAWRRAWRVASDRVPAGEPDYAGALEFRQAVVDHLLRHRGLPAGADQVLATAGTTDALDELAALLPAGASVGFEEPGYRRAAETLVARGIRLVPVPVDGDGLRVDRLPSGLAAVYCTPAHQFPLGPRLSAARRVALVERARAEGFLVLEDDYDGELRYDVAPLPLLAALGPDVVAYLGTSSKLLTPTLGVGWLVAPPAMHAELLAARERAGMRPSPAGQLVFAALADYGDLARHLRRLRAELTERRARVVAALSGTGAALLGDAAGAHLRVTLPSAAAERALMAAAAEAGVLLQGLLDCHRCPPSAFGVSLGYARPPRPALDRGVAIVADLVRRAWSDPVSG